MSWVLLSILLKKLWKGAKETGKGKSGGTLSGACKAGQRKGPKLSIYRFKLRDESNDLSSAFGPFCFGNLLGAAVSSRCPKLCKNCFCYSNIYHLVALVSTLEYFQKKVKRKNVFFTNNFTLAKKYVIILFVWLLRIA